ncbi:hypothetical protein FD755_012464 [Muntiacus reevesi]|uniref:Transmembrane protein 168 n=2 Tax=Muntiacus TaxID=9885 RepID=A0A5N3XTG9_MUNRE|nr:hypothetical protein FD754_020548 [Muntiacus muntjak]KAB0375821.1 hypothetical protein FD755_012464 [Muntiacus reevesi]
MCKSLRYCFSHCLYLAMTRLEEVNREVNMHSSVRYLGYLARINLLVAICLGLYVRWEKTANSLILVIFILGLFVLGIASILYYYFSMEAASLSLSNLWFGFLLGLLCFLDNSSFKNDVKEESTKYLLLTSIVLRILCSLVERISGYVRHRPTLLTTVEFLELVGFAIASTTMLVEKSLSVILLVVALAMLIIDLRMKSFLAIPNLVIFAVLLFFSSLETPKNPVAFACFFICLITDPFLDIYFSGLSVTERWKPFLYRGRICRRLSVVFTGMIELTFFILSAFKLRDTHLWYFVIPGFSIFGIFWMICHIIFLLTLWGFHTKLNDCHKVCFTHRVDNNSLDRIMASKGMRHFCLISEQLVFFSGDILRLDTLLEWWREKNGSFCSRLIIILDSENSTPWVKEVRKINDQYIAVQGAEMTKTIDIEEADPPQLGDFTKDWVEYNCNTTNNICWTEKGRTVKAVYGVSKRWSDYTLHLPTGSDVAKHWMLYFPRITYPLVHLANWLCGLNLFWICKTCFRCLKRLKMSWFLPAVLDTGQGFKLVKS